MVDAFLLACYMGMRISCKTFTRCCVIVVGVFFCLCSNGFLLKNFLQKKYIIATIVCLVFTCYYCNGNHTQTSVCSLIKCQYHYYYSLFFHTGHQHELWSSEQHSTWIISVSKGLHMILNQLVIFRWDWLDTTRPYDGVRSANSGGRPLDIQLYYHKHR